MTSAGGVHAPGPVDEADALPTQWPTAPDHQAWKNELQALCMTALPATEGESETIENKEPEIPLHDDLNTLVRLQNGVSTEEVQELIAWLGPQAYKLLQPVRIVEFSGGTKHRVTREAERRGHNAIAVLGISHGQDLRGK